MGRSNERRVDRSRDDRDRRRDVDRRSRSRDLDRKRRSSVTRDSRSPKRRRSRSRTPPKRKHKEKKHKKEKKKRKKKKRESSSEDDTSDDDSSGADSDSSTELLLRLEKERLELKEKRKQEKDRLKAFETPEEKRARRLLKKELKAQKERGKLGWDQEYVHYTNDDNPFGDPNLMQNFRWQKKLQKEGLDKVDDHELHRIQRMKQTEQRVELEKVKQRRLEREREREERQSMKELEDRQRENEKFSKWQRDEDDFHLQQAKMRSKIRIQDGRAKPIDLLAKYISAEEDLDAIEMHEPYTYLNGLTIKDLEDLLEDIKVYVTIDHEKNHQFWADITVIVEDELHKLHKMDAKSQYEQAAERRQGINKAVASDVQEVFKGKTAEELATLQRKIEQKLAVRAEGLDISYWESLLVQLKAHLARARLRDKHKENLRQKLQLLKEEQGVEEQLSPRPGPSSAAASADEEEDPEVVMASMLDPALKEFQDGGYSPKYVDQDELELGTLVMTEEEEVSRRQVDQNRVLKGVKVENVMNAEEKALEREAKKGMGGDEASFSVESVLDQKYEWSDKYRPRKPRYFNRVHTGFEWNKYNQTHYDVDNPPPKIVQGYKFNIFYPDLIEKNQTPQYTLVPCTDNPDFAILRIHAGPPYEDIAFKIVNREWEFGYKRGFKCQFLNNIFQLWFHFKRLRYRR